MPRPRVLVALAVLVLTSALSISVAHAGTVSRTTGLIVGGGSTTTSNPWPWPIICTTAAFTDYGVWNDNGDVHIYFEGTTQPCPGVTDPGARRSFTLYSGGVATLSGHVAPLFDADTRSYTFDVSGHLGSYDAFCLIDGLYVKTRSDGTRLGMPSKRDCVAVDRSGTSPVVTTIPTSDPRVAAYVENPVNNPGGVPYCSSCL